MGRHITLERIKNLPKKIGLMVTGTGAINHRGLRFGKGHGFFELQWAMLHSIWVMGGTTQIVAVVHEC
jgi:5-formyltetrahydrofolate cyclo-ligase